MAITRQKSLKENQQKSEVISNLDSERLKSEHEELLAKYDKLNGLYSKLETEYSELKRRYDEQNREYQAVKTQFDNISNAFFWRISGPIRAILTPIKKAIFHIESNGKEIPDEPDNTIKTLSSLFEKRYVVILATRHTLYVAKLIQNALRRIDIDSGIITDEPEKYENYMHIVICPQMFNKMPGFYISFQMEQTISARWFDQDYLDKLKNSYAILDYSVQNIDFFKKKTDYGDRFYYLPIDSLSGVENHSEGYEYDVVFYGDANSPRRERILSQLQTRFRIKIITNLFGSELETELKKAKVIVNIHYYENSLLETTRLYESLSFGRSVIVSERSNDSFEEKNLEGIVDFVDAWDVESLVERIEYWLSHDEERNAKVRENNAELSNRPNSFDFFFYRFLLANELISFDLFYKLAGNYVTFSSNRLCLSLPESLDRRKSFDIDNIYGFEVFPGLRHIRGWTGCGLSYKYIFRRAKELGFSSMLICEDDVLFPEDFKRQWEECEDYIRKQKNWDIFQGLIADVGDVTISRVEHIKDKTFVHLNRMVSNVLNCFNSTVFDYYINWDEKNPDVQNNAIDRAIEKHELSIITTVPFLVGHKEDLDSTLWDFNNSHYREMITRSSEKLYLMVEDFETKRDRTS